MRTRQNRVHIRLTDEEKRHLEKLQEQTGLSASAIIRSFFAKRKAYRILREKPTQEYSMLIRELSAIGNNVNQILHVAENNNIEPEIIKDFKNSFLELSKAIKNL